MQLATKGHKSLSHFIQTQSGFQQTEVFGPQYFSYGQDVIDQMNTTDIANDVEVALRKFANPDREALKTQLLKQINGASNQKQNIPQSRPQTIQLDESLPSHLQSMTDFLLEESQNLYEDFAILNDPIALQLTLKDQYEKSKRNQSETESCNLDDSIISAVPLMNLKINNKPKLDRPWSQLIDKEERDLAFNAGHSLDAKKMTEALGFLDMKQICYCLAHAIMKHIEFGKGFYFLADLQQYLKQFSKQDQQKLLENSTDSRNPYRRNAEDELEFTYALGELPLVIPPK